MTTAERAANELADLVARNPSISDGLAQFERIYDAYMIEMAGDFVDKREALLDAFRAKALEGDLAQLIADKLGAV
ncbi:hypothetical protein DFR50_1319 [Roseiarcus fermentans]|uniref:Uncharacterized protein n=1 Tax=Roseiarcus fermentans TaxID=1473586 RepID=A0A366EY05_9HYPH|nr:hypothetical protein [Roseiarcus fermentans]RBP06389.1 hypothetical protein DFR50_1319 [Roseiarcus fermentans]